MQPKLVAFVLVPNVEEGGLFVGGGGVGEVDVELGEGEGEAAAGKLGVELFLHVVEQSPVVGGECPCSHRHDDGAVAQRVEHHLGGHFGDLRMVGDI